MEKYVRLSFVILGLLVWVVMASFFATVMNWISPDLDRFLMGARFAISDALGMICGIATAVVLWFHEAANRLGLEVASELRNVTWPSWPETRVSTIVVLVTTVVISLILGLFDLIMGGLSGLIYRL